MTYSSTQWQPTTHDLDTFTMDGLRWLVSAEKSYSFKTTDNNTFRFELREGDRFSSTRHTDVQGAERAEMGEADQHSISGNGKHFAGEYKFMIEPGPTNTSGWLVMGQIHDNNGRTPPFEVKFVGDDKMTIVAKYDNGDGRPISVTLFKDTQNIQRGHWYTMKIDVQLDAKGGGHAHVWRDGVEIVDYAGKIGYTDSSTSRWKMGVYRDTPKGGETIAVQYKDVDLTYGTAAHSDTGPKSSPTPSTPAPQKVIKGTSNNDVRTGTSASEVFKTFDGNDRIDGRAGNDKLWSGLGKDTLTGGSGKDAFVFYTKPNKSTNKDKVVDFNAKDDSLWLDNKFFTKLGKVGTETKPAQIKKGFFTVGSEAKDKNDYIVYNKAKGVLYYDADGSGKGEAMQIATLSKKPVMTYHDLFVV